MAGAVELALNRGTLSVAADGMHNVGDAITYHLQAKNILDPALGEEKRQQRRVLTHWVIATSSVYIGSKAGLDIAYGHESTSETTAVYTAGASVALNSILFGRLWQGMRRTKMSNPGHEHSIDTHHLAKHFWGVDIPSAVIALGGAFLKRYDLHVEEQCAAVASGALGAWVFRPTRKNMAGHKH